MQEGTKSLQDSNGNPFFVYEWLPDPVTPLRAIIQIIHGMMEHAGRYHDFAQFLTGHGFAVVAEDHFGHGRTAGDARDLGHLNGKKGWHMILEQIRLVMEHTRSNYPDVPYVVFGHSMGSVLARHAAIIVGSAIDGLVLSGVEHTSCGLIRTGSLLACGSRLVYGSHYRNRMINYLTYKVFNRYFRPNRTGFDWLSTDDIQVDRYVNDPHCGFPSTSGFYQGMFYGLKSINKKNQLARIPARLSVLILSGESDPVGDFGKGPRKVAEQLQQAGLADITVKLYPGGRHEMLHETSNQVVVGDILTWLNKKFTSLVVMKAENT